MVENISKEKIVVDASVIMASLMDDEIDDEEFFKYLKLAANELVELWAPALLKLEIVSSLTWAVNRKRCNWDTARRQLKIFLAMPIKYDDRIDGIEELFDLSKKYGLTSYDGRYLRMVIGLKAKLLSNDKLLLKIYKLYKND
jgi:predicted nucleic acid-binding protein